MKLLNRMAQRLYVLLNRRKILTSPAVRGDLERLYPGTDAEAVYRNYYVEKLEKSMTILLVGTVLAALMAVRAAGQRELVQGHLVRRGEVLDEAQEVVVETVLEGKKERFRVQVQPLQMSEEEAQACYQEFCQKLPQLIAGQNASLQEVTQELELLESFEGYPFYVEWRSDNVDCVSTSGTVKPGEEDVEVCLTADISYWELQWEYQLTVRVLAQQLTLEQQRHNELEEQLLASENRDALEEYWALPESLGDVALKWSRVVEDNSLLMWAGALAVSAAVYILGDRDLHEKVEKRKECMKREYPDIVHKLALYLGAGMTLQGAFQKIAAEYEQKKTAGGPAGPAYEEMLYTCRELQSGVSEGSAYEHFGKRIGLQEYIRLSTLMTQNLKRGNSSLLPRLHEEAERALTERIRMGKKLGEEASTKLLVPMVMMLAVVMVMVMLPAFGSMGL